MKPVKIAPNQFINPDHIVEFTYAPATTRTEKVPDEQNYNMAKTTQIDIGSSLTLTLTTGKQIRCYNVEADAIYVELTSRS
jgi:hypothetical protein